MTRDTRVFISATILFIAIIGFFILLFIYPQILGWALIGGSLIGLFIACLVAMDEFMR